MKVSAGVQVTYTRPGTGQSVTLTAWVDRTAFSQSPPEPGGASLIWGDRDYMIAVEDLKLGGVPVEPALADQIRETIGGAVVTFEVMTPDTGEPAWRYSDPTRTVWRVHVKKA
jgi:hypothetical protein